MQKIHTTFGDCHIVAIGKYPYLAGIFGRNCPILIRIYEEEKLLFH